MSKKSQHANLRGNLFDFDCAINLARCKFSDSQTIEGNKSLKRFAYQFPRFFADFLPPLSTRSFLRKSLSNRSWLKRTVHVPSIVNSRSSSEIMFVSPSSNIIFQIKLAESRYRLGSWIDRSLNSNRIVEFALDETLVQFNLLHPRIFTLTATRNWFFSQLKSTCKYRWIKQMYRSSFNDFITTNTGFVTLK